MLVGRQRADGGIGSGARAIGPRPGSPRYAGRMLLEARAAGLAVERLGDRSGSPTICANQLHNAPKRHRPGRALVRRPAGAARRAGRGGRFPEPGRPAATRRRERAAARAGACCRWEDRRAAGRDAGAAAASSSAARAAARRRPGRRSRSRGAAPCCRRCVGQVLLLLVHACGRRRGCSRRRSRCDPAHPLVGPLVETVAQRGRAELGWWWNTQDYAAAVEALARYDTYRQRGR